MNFNFFYNFLTQFPILSIFKLKKIENTKIFVIIKTNLILKIIMKRYSTSNLYKKNYLS
jgi:hypothetical protein